MRIKIFPEKKNPTTLLLYPQLFMAAYEFPDLAGFPDFLEKKKQSENNVKRLTLKHTASDSDINATEWWQLLRGAG